MAFFARLILTLFGMAFAVLFAVGVLFWLALFVTFASVRWLVTGQKPQVVMMWRQIRTMRKGMQTRQSTRWSSWSRSGDGQWHVEQGHSERSDHKTDAVEDVVVREVHDKHYLPKD
jgi:hypothetical protein